MYYTTQTAKVNTLFLEFPQNEKLKKATVRNQGKTVPCFSIPFSCGRVTFS